MNPKISSSNTVNPVRPPETISMKTRDGTRLAVSRTWREGLDRALGGAIKMPKDTDANR